MDSVLDDRSPGSSTRPNAATAGAVRRKSTLERPPVGFVRTIGYTMGFWLCALGVIARLVSADTRSNLRHEEHVAAAPAPLSERAAVHAVREEDLPVAPQPAALIDRTPRPDLASARMAALAAAAVEREAKARAAAEAALAPPTAKPPVRIRIERHAAPPGPVRPAPSDSQRVAASSRPPGSERSLVEGRGETPARAAAVASACPTCECNGLLNKRLFTLEPFRREEQVWYKGHCRP